MSVVPTTLTDAVLRRVARDSRSLLIIPVKARVTRLESLEPFATRFNERTYLLTSQRNASWS